MQFRLPSLRLSKSRYAKRASPSTYPAVTLERHPVDDRSCCGDATISWSGADWNLNRDFHFAARIGTLIHDILVRTPDFFVATFIQLPIPVSSGRARRGTDWSPDSRAFVRHLCALAPFLRQMFSVSGHPLSVRHRQRPDPPQHVAEQPPGQMPFRQQEPAGASSTVRASPAGPRFSPVAAGDS